MQFVSCERASLLTEVIVAIQGSETWIWTQALSVISYETLVK